MSSFEYYGGSILAIFCTILIYKTVSLFLRLTELKWKRIGLFISCYLLGNMVIFIGDIVNLPPTLLLFFAGVVCCCSGSFLSKVTMGLMFASIAFSFNAIVDNFLMFAMFHRVNTLIPRVIFWGMMYLLGRKYAPEKGYELYPALWKLLICLTMIPIGIVLSIVLLVNPRWDTLQKDMLCYLVLLLTALLSNVVIMWTVTILIKQTKLERQSALTKVNQSYYEMMEEQQFQVRRLKHDMTNHLQTVRALPLEEKDSYLGELVQNPVFKQTLSYSGDPTMNAVISSKMDMMERYHISFQVKADTPDELPFEKPDICAMLANILDNAIEACCKLPEQSREIQLEVKVQKGLFVLKSTNPFRKETPRAGFETTKKNQTEHGYGLKSIREVAGRYHGKMEIKVEEDRCQVFLYIPCRVFL